MKITEMEAQGLQDKLDALLTTSLGDKGGIARLMAHYRISGLYNYSLFNSLMILCQGGTVCNSYKRWQEMGRQVRKGEKARIWVYRPLVMKKTDKETGKDQMVFTGKFFMAGVFDVSQTDGKPIEFDHNSTDVAPVSIDQAKAIAEGMGFPVREETITQGARGYTDGKTIVLNSIANDTDKAKTLFHELAHCLLEHTGKNEHGATKDVIEVEAESCAYLVMSGLGMDYEMSESYVSAYKSGIASADKAAIVKAAGKILKALATA